MSDLHELLPWYMNGTLAEAERGAFEDHLSGCADCREEISNIREIQPDLPDLTSEEIAQHPTPQDLLETVQPGTGDVDLEPEAARNIRRHLALCVNCADSARWLASEAVAAPADGGRAHRDLPSPDRAAGRSGIPPWVRWAALAATAVLVIAVGIGLVDRPGLPRGGQLRFEVVPSVERDRTGRHLVDVAPGADVVHLLFEVDLPPEAFPVSFEIVDATGRGVLLLEDLAATDLDRGIFLLVGLDRRESPDGDYLGRLSSPGQERPLVQYPFRLHSTR